jgi:hypothetical protein
MDTDKKKRIKELKEQKQAKADAGKIIRKGQVIDKEQDNGN